MIRLTGIQSYEGSTFGNTSERRPRTGTEQGGAARAERGDEDDRVTISDEARASALSNAAQAGGSASHTGRAVEFFTGPAHRIPPEGASLLEEMAYRRDAIRLDTRSRPYRFADSGAELTQESWLAAEQIIDQRVDGRIAAYNRARADGLGNDQIRARIEAYNGSLSPAFSHQADLAEGLIAYPPALAHITQWQLTVSLPQRRKDFFERTFGAGAGAPSAHLDTD